MPSAWDRRLRKQADAPSVSLKDAAWLAGWKAAESKGKGKGQASDDAGKGSGKGKGGKGDAAKGGGKAKGQGKADQAPGKGKGKDRTSDAKGSRKGKGKSAGWFCASQLCKIHQGRAEWNSDDDSICHVCYTPQPIAEVQRTADLAKLREKAAGEQKKAAEETKNLKVAEDQRKKDAEAKRKKDEEAKKVAAPAAANSPPAGAGGVRPQGPTPVVDAMDVDQTDLAVLPKAFKEILSLAPRATPSRVKARLCNPRRVIATRDPSLQPETRYCNPRGTRDATRDTSLA